MSSRIYGWAVVVRIVLSFVFISVFSNVFASIVPQTATLSNGLKVAVFQNPMLPSVTVFTAYDIGTADDPLDMVGLSHMLEHMMFKGSSKFPKDSIDKAVALRGGWVNALTSFDSTVYIVSLPSEHLELAFDIESDRMENLEITEEEFLPEQKVVMEERLMRMNNHPLKTAVEVAQRIKFIAHPYGIWPIGFEAHIKAYTVEALQKHYKTWYVPNNATVVVVGPYSLDHVLPLVEKYFGSIAATDLPARKRIPEPDREGLTATIEQESKRVENVMLSISYRAPTFAAQPEKMLAMRLLEDSLVGTDNRELVKEIIKNKRLALELSADYSCGKDDQFFSFNIVLAPEMSCEKLEDFLFEKLRYYLRNGISRKDFEHAKKEILNQLEFALDGDTFLLAVANDYIKGMSKDALQNYEKILASITIEQVQEMLRTILSNPPILVSRINPARKSPKRFYHETLGA